MRPRREQRTLDAAEADAAARFAGMARARCSRASTSLGGTQRVDLADMGNLVAVRAAMRVDQSLPDADSRMRQRLKLDVMDARRALARSYLRAVASGRAVTLASDLEWPLEERAAPQDDTESRELVDWALGQLDDDERAVLRLKFWSDLSTRQIGKTIGKSQVWASILVRRALGKVERLVAGQA